MKLYFILLISRALAKNCAVKDICEDGADAQDKWRDGKPVRVVRSYKMLKHFPEFAPKEGIRLCFALIIFIFIYL